MCCVLCVLRYGVCWSLSFSLFPLSYLCGVLYNMIVLVLCMHGGVKEHVSLGGSVFG